MEGTINCFSYGKKILSYAKYFHCSCHAKPLYHAIENTANQNTEKPLYNRRYYIQPSHHALSVCRIDCAGPCIFYGMVIVQFSRPYSPVRPSKI